MWRRTVCLLLAVALLGLTGCGYSGEKNKNSDKDRPKPAAGN